MKPLPLTPELLAHAWDYICCLPPFDKMSMPPSDDIKFRVTKATKHFGQYQIRGGAHHIDISSRLVGSHIVLLSTLMHEGIHLHLQEVDACDMHGPNFKALAKVVCDLHGFDELTF